MFQISIVSIIIIHYLDYQSKLLQRVKRKDFEGKISFLRFTRGLNI